MNWKYVKQLQSVELINEFEKEKNFTFPDDFKAVVFEYNGARPEYDIYDTNKTKERTVKSLLSFNKSDKETIWKIAEWNKNELSDKLVAFAIDQFGNLICFSASDKSVVFLNMESLEIEKIAESFSDFLGKLYKLD